MQQERKSFDKLQSPTKEEKTDELPKTVKTKKSFLKFLHSLFPRKRNKPVEKKHIKIIKEADIGSENYYLAKQ